MTQTQKAPSSLETFRKKIDDYIESIKGDLWSLNKQVHDNPEIAFQEHKAHDAVTKFLEDHQRSVTRHAYGVDTAFESRAGSKGRLVNFNSELDALPGLGHACGHNLICIAGVAAYMALSSLVGEEGLQGQTQLLGTPAEEDGGGKIVLMEKGAYDGVDVSLMAHPTSITTYKNTPYAGTAGQSSLSIGELLTTYTGRPAHAAANPWDGLNALDALVAAYNNVSLLRQQIHPDERIHGAILSTPSITNAIPSHTVVKYTIRAPKISRLVPLMDRVQACLNAGALATGCSSTTTEPDPRYANIKVNLPLCEAFASAMQAQGLAVKVSDPEPLPASTDMGNVTHLVPGLHAHVGLPIEEGDEGAFPHNEGFERVAGTREAFERFMCVAKALAVVGVLVWSDDAFFGRVKGGFEVED